MIVADDLGFSDLGAYGGEISTPNLDRLARGGLRFTQFYNNAVCNVSRLSMMTGLYPRFGEAGLLRPNMVTVSEVLKQAGYATVLTGKWHLGRDEQNRPTARGFNEYYGVPSGACNYFDPAMPEAIDGPLGRRPFWHNRESVDHFPDDFYTTDAFTRHAVENIQRLAAGSQPFFVNVCYTAPHYPLQAREHDVMRYRGRYDKGYFELRKSRYRRLVELGLIRSSWELPDADPKLGSWYYDYEIEPWGEVKEPEQARRRMEVYAAMVESLDDSIGRLMRTLEQVGLADNTVFIFTADNGGLSAPEGPDTPATDNAPLRAGKGYLYEGGLRVPLIVAWPGRIKAGSVNHTPVYSADLFATALAIADLNNSTGVDGMSLLPLLTGRGQFKRDALYWHYPHYSNQSMNAGDLDQPGAAIRQGDYKLIEFYQDNRIELYDLKNDLSERHDLARSHPRQAAALRQRLAAWRDAVGAQMMTANPLYNTGK